MTNTELLTFSTAESISIPMIQIPAGEFLMGSDESDPDAHSDEMPQHPVHLQGFFMGQTPITQAQWRAVAKLPPVDRKLDPDPSYFTGDSLPVERVSWHEAIEFCARLSIETGELITLPSEAQWEYVCRAGTTTAYAFGDTLTNQVANCEGNTTTPVGTYSANPWGLYDIHGNVWEWCLDDYHASYEGAPTDGSAWVRGDSLGKCSGAALGSGYPSTTAPLSASTATPPLPTAASVSASAALVGDSLGKSCAAAPGTTIPTAAARPTGAASGRPTASTSSVSASAPFVGDRLKVLRGGSWVSDPRDCRSPYRIRIHPDDRINSIGFRVCCLPHG
jgi:formylglycine-generating enzyme required for sulfatase activity